MTNFFRIVDLTKLLAGRKKLTSNNLNTEWWQDKAATISTKLSH